MLYPQGVNSDITLLSTVVPSQVSVRARLSTLLERIKSFIEVALFLIDREFNETRDTLFSRFFLDAVGSIDKLERVDFNV